MQQQQASPPQQTSQMVPNAQENGANDPNMGSGDQGECDKTKLIVNYIPQLSTEEDLAQIFTPIGRVESIKIMRDYKTGYSFGFGFVKYYTVEDAAKAIETVNGMSYKNKRLKVSYSRPPGADMKASNLYITNLPKDVTEQDIDNMFSDYGEIVQKSVLKDKITGMPRGVAFVRFSKGEEAQAAIANLDGKLLDNALFPLSVRVAEDHGRQKAQYMDSWTMHHQRGYMPFRGAAAAAAAAAAAIPFRKMAPPSDNLQNRNLHNNNNVVGGGGGGAAAGGPNRYQNYHTNVKNMGAAGDNYLQSSFYC